MRTIIKYLIGILLIGVFFILKFTFSSHVEDKLEKVLEFAGSNRYELEKVLTYYENDSLKLAAAEFLIKNMNRKYGLEGEELEQLKIIYKELYETNFPVWSAHFDKNTLQKWQHFTPSSLDIVYDCHVIDSEFLIENIEYAFLVWEKYPWNKTLSFEDFCEYILPYRVGNEKVEPWRKEYYEKYSPVLDSLYRGTDVVEACKKMCEYLKNKRFCFNQQINTPPFWSGFFAGYSYWLL